MVCTATKRGYYWLNPYKGYQILLSHHTHCHPLNGLVAYHFSIVVNFRFVFLLDGSLAASRLFFCSAFLSSPSRTWGLFRRLKTPIKIKAIVKIAFTQFFFYTTTEETTGVFFMHSFIKLSIQLSYFSLAI
mgnify:CR=1 FL=1